MALYFPSEIFNDPHSTAVIFHGPTLHVRFYKSVLELLIRKNVFSSEITDVVKGHLTKMKICLAKREKPAKKRIVFIDFIVIFEEKLLQFFHDPSFFKLKFWWPPFEAPKSLVAPLNIFRPPTRH